MVRWLFALLLAALATLAAARYVPAPTWIDFLWACFAFGAAAIGVALGILLRTRAPTTWRGHAALSLALAAGASRATVLFYLSVDRRPAVTIDVTAMMVASASLAWGALALLWGVSALADAVVSPGAPSRFPWFRLAETMLAVILALFAVAPLGRLLGLRVDVWTLVGLFGLATVAYLIDRIYEHIVAKITKDG